MPTDQLERGQTDNDPDKQYDTAQNLWSKEVDFGSKVNDIRKRSSSDSARGSTDVENDVDANGSDVGSFIKDVNDKEKNPGAVPKNTPSSQPSSHSKQKGGAWSKLLAGSKKFGASGGAIGLILALFGGTSLILAPGALLVNIEKALTNDGSDASRMNIVMRRAYMGSIFSKKTCSGSLCKKMSTISDVQKKKWEALGWKVESTEEDGRHKVTKMTSPDNVEISDAKSWQNYSENTVEGRKHANRVLNVRAAYFQNSKFTKVLDKFKISKSKRLASSTDRDKAERTKAINQSFDENTEATTGDEEERVKSYRSKTVESGETKSKISTAKNASSKAASAAGAVSAACVAYNATRIAVATVKAKWIYDLVKFAFPFVQAAAQIEDQGNIEPETVEILADRLTWYDNRKEVDGQPNPKYNLTAMDAQGVEMAIYGDFTALKEFAKQYTTGYIGAAVVGNSLVNWLHDNVGKDTIHDACTGATVLSAYCKGGVGKLVCAGGALLGYVFGPDIMEALVNEFADDAIHLIAQANLNSQLRGVDAGNAMAAGVGLMLMKGSMGYGLKPAASVAAVNSFIAATDELNYKYTEQIARDEAREAPFDATNQYSFTGQIASAFNPYRSNDETIFSQLLNGFAVATSPISRLSTANALYSQPSNMTTEPNSAQNRMEKMIDPEMAEIGAVNDWSGRMVGVVSDDVLKQAAEQANDDNQMIADNIQYMIDKKYIKDDGSVNNEEEDNQYAKYKEYCTEDRVDPLGTTTKPIEEGSNDDQNWFTGKRCLGTDEKDKEMLDNFAIYFNICESQYATAEGVDNCWSAQAASAVTPSGGNWVIPTVGPCLSPYGQRWGKLHAGIDISPPAGTPIVAPTDMTITSAGMNSGGYGNMVTGTEVGGSGYSFRFGHMQSITAQQGATVKKGETIGTVGSTGDSTGPHLHFEIFPPGGNPASYSGAVDPVPVLGQHGVTIAC